MLRGTTRRATAAAWLLAGALLGGALLARPAAGGSSADSGPGLPWEGPWVVRVRVDDRGAIDRLSSLVEPWAIYPDKGVALVAVDGELWRRLQLAGFAIEIDEPRSLRLGRTRSPLPGQRGGIPGFPCYRTVEETYAAAEALAAARPELAAWIEVGSSWERLDDPDAGYELRALRIGAGAADEERPALLVLGGLHAREYATAELNTRFAELLVDGYDDDPEIRWLLDEYDVYLVLQANPDGRKRAEQGILWRKNADDLFCTGTNDRGVDLNRNFAFGWGCCGGSSPFECAATYRGPSAGSEPETSAVQDLMRSIFVDRREPPLDSPAQIDAQGVFLDLHSFGEDVLWSWGFTTERPPNDGALYSLGRKLAFFNDYRPQHGSLSTVDGATKDFAYGELGVPGFTIELGTDFFQDCTTFDSIIVPDNLSMLLYAAKAVRVPYAEPAGPEVVAVESSSRVHFPGEIVTIGAVLDDTRFSQRNGVEPVQAIVEGELSIGAPPWRAETVVPLQPSDGAFDSPVEEVSAVIDTATLPAGRHVVFLRGRDGDGSWGVPSSIFLYVVQPQVAPIVQGFVRDAVSGEGIAARVAVGAVTTSTDPNTGWYRLRLPAATPARMKIEPFDPFIYLEPEAEPVSLVAGEAVRRDVRLRRYDVLAVGEWLPGGDWQQSTETAPLEEGVWSDSPWSNYAPNREASLTSQVLSIGPVEQPVLAFEHVYDFESGFDFGVVELSVDDGEWVELLRFSGTRSAWRAEGIGLGEHPPEARLRVRFRAVSDDTVERDGWHLGRIRILARRR